MNTPEREFLQEQFRNVTERLDRIEISLNGGESGTGIKIQVDRNTRAIDTAKRILWVVLTPILVALSGGMLILMIHVSGGRYVEKSLKSDGAGSGHGNVIPARLQSVHAGEQSIGPSID